MNIIPIKIIHLNKHVSLDNQAPLDNRLPLNNRIVINRLSLAKRDQYFFQIHNLIEAKRKMLLDKKKKIRLISKQNHFLNEIKEDYNKYNNFIVQQKSDQIQALDLLNNYIHDLTVSGKLSKHNIEDAKYEQGKIIKELNTIKKNLDNIINETDDINLSLKQ